MDERRPNPTKGNQTPTTNGQGGIQRGQRLIWVQMNWREELVVRVGFGD